MMGCHDIRPLLPARLEELTPLEARVRALHVAGCARCATEAASYNRLVQTLATMANLEATPPDSTLERILVAIGRRRVRATDPRVMVAAGAGGALVATVMVARALRQRRRVPAPAAPGKLSLPSVVSVGQTAVLARVK